MQEPTEVRRGIISLCPGITNSCNPLFWCRELKPGPLEEQRVLLTTASVIIPYICLKSEKPRHFPFLFYFYLALTSKDCVYLCAIVIHTYTV